MKFVSTTSFHENLYRVSLMFQFSHKFTVFIYFRVSCNAYTKKRQCARHTKTTSACSDRWRWISWVFFGQETGRKGPSSPTIWHQRTGMETSWRNEFYTGLLFIFLQECDKLYLFIDHLANYTSHLHSCTLIA